ncbi:MAG: phosphoribosylglycinamide formyltransferase [Maioricimonas sp. JB045]
MPLGQQDTPFRLAVLISGGGTTLINFLEQIGAGRLEVEIPVVIASRDCKGVERARAAGLRCEVIRPRDFDSIDRYSAAVFAVIREVGADLVTLAGFLSRLAIPDDFEERVINIHPALIPSFCGKGMYGHHVHEAVLDRGCKLSGCTVHFADNEYDHGPIILQKAVPVFSDDTPDTLAARVFEAECEAYPEAIRLIAQGRVRVRDGRVHVAPGKD